jgi:hypothetical protein
MFSSLQYVGQLTNYFRTLSFAKPWQIPLQCEPDFPKWIAGNSYNCMVMKDTTIVYLGLFSFWNEVSSEYTQDADAIPTPWNKSVHVNVEECTQMAQLHLLIA